MENVSITALGNSEVANIVSVRRCLESDFVSASIHNHYRLSRNVATVDALLSVMATSSCINQSGIQVILFLLEGSLGYI
jgi:hypothetical protein